MIDVAAEKPSASIRRELVDRLARFGRHVRLHLAAEGAAYTVVAALALVVVTLVLDRWLQLSLPARGVLLSTAVGALIYLAWRRVLKPLLRRIEPIDLAAAIDRAAAARSREDDGARRSGAVCAVAPRVASVLQLPDLLHSSFAPSVDIVETAVQRRHRELGRVRFDRHLDRRRGLLCVAVVLVAFLLPAWWARVDSDTAGLWFRRWFLASNEGWPQSTHLRVHGVVDGRIIVPRGEPFVLRVEATEASRVVPDTVTLRIETAEAKPATAAMKVFGANDFRYEFSSVYAPLMVRVRGGDDEAGPVRIEPVDRPRLTQIELSAHHSQDTNPQSFSLVGRDADLSFLARTRLALTMRAGAPLADVRMSTTPDGLAPFTRVDDRTVSLEWTHTQAVQLQFTLIGREAGLWSRPIAINIGLKIDREPRVDIRVRGVRERITAAATIPVTVVARDDFGVATVSLGIRTQPPRDLPSDQPASDAPPLGGTRTVSLAGPFDPVTEKFLEVPSEVDVSALKPAAGTLIYVSGLAKDACYEGAQTGESRARPFRVVEDEELFREILLRVQSDRSRVRKMLRAAEDLRAGLDALVSADEAALLGRRHRLIQQQVHSILRSLSASATEIRLNRLGSVQMHDLLADRVIGPLRDLHDGTMTRQRRDLERLSRTVDQAGVEGVVENQDLIVDRLKQVLLQMKQWDSFVDVVNQLNEVIKLHNRVWEQTKEYKEKAVEDIFDH